MSEAAKRSTRVQEATVSAREQELAKKLLFDSKAQREYVQHFMGWVTQTKGVQQQERILVVGEFRLTTLKKHAGLVKGRSKLSISKTPIGPTHTTSPRQETQLLQQRHLLLLGLCGRTIKVSGLRA